MSLIIFNVKDDLGKRAYNFNLKRSFKQTDR